MWRRTFGKPCNTQHASHAGKSPCGRKRVVRFLCDMGVSMSKACSLRESRHDVVHLREESLHKLPDADIVKKARQEERTIPTFDLESGGLLAAGLQLFPSMILFCPHNLIHAFMQATRLGCPSTSYRAGAWSGSYPVPAHPAPEVGLTRARGCASLRTPMKREVYHEGRRAGLHGPRCSRDLGGG